MKIVAIIQARMGSIRLPQKIMTEFCGHPMLWHILKRVEKSKYINQIYIATSKDTIDNIVELFAKRNNVMIWRGSHNNVLERFFECASHCNADIIIRLTADNALIDSNIIDMGIEYFLKNDYDYIYYREGLPIGLAVEIFTYNALKYTYKKAKDIQCLEHVTPYMYQNPQIFCIKRVPCIGENHENLRWTLDTEEDRKLIYKIYESLYISNNFFTYEDILKEYLKHPEWTKLNKSIEQVKVTYKGECVI